MNAPVLTCFSAKGGVGTTSLIYHVAWMLADLDYSVLAVDLDPQANLTGAFLSEDVLEGLWSDSEPSDASTMYKCIAPLMDMGDLQSPDVCDVADNLHLLPGDLSLSGLEDSLSAEWPNCLASEPDIKSRAFRVVTAFWQVIRSGAAKCRADVVLVDVGPSLGAVNRSALIATDFVVVPLGTDLFSRQGLRNLGPTLRRWRRDWKTRRAQRERPEVDLPKGDMTPAGYVIQQYDVRLSRPVMALDRWVNEMPTEYARHVIAESAQAVPAPANDANCIATIKPYRSLVSLGRDARKPIFSLAPADGAIGSHAVAARDAYADFMALAEELLRRCGVAGAAPLRFVAGSRRTGAP